MLSYRIDRAVAALVLQDGLAREVSAMEYDDQTPTGVTVPTMLFRDGGTVRSAPLADWPAEQARITAQEAEQAGANALRAQIIQAAQSAVGQPVNTLTAVQVRALFAIQLFKDGALTNQGVVRPLGEWVK